MRRFLVLVLGLMVFVADQASKSWANGRLAGDHSITLVPNYLELTLTTNTGAAFGMFQSSTLLLGLIALAAGIGIAVYVITHKKALPLYQAIALGLVLGGACGNFVDRFRLRHVIDFIFLHAGVHQWPVFNLADSAICVGVVLLAFRYVIHSSSEERRAESKPTVGDAGDAGAPDGAVTTCPGANMASAPVSTGPVEPSVGPTE